MIEGLGAGGSQRGEDRARIDDLLPDRTLLSAMTGMDATREPDGAMPGRLRTARLDLVPLGPADATEMVTVLAAEELYAFIGGGAPSVDQLRSRYQRLAVGGSADGNQEWHNWIVRLRPGGEAIGTVQATILDDGRRAAVAWVIGVPWQGRGFAGEAATALVAWLEERDVDVISAHIRPGHTASERVAVRAGLAPTEEIDHDGERVWYRGRTDRWDRQE